MIPHKLALGLTLFFLAPQTILAQQRKPPAGGRPAIVVDERLAALRVTPQLNGRLLRRLGRGRMVAIRATRKSSDGIEFHLVNVSSRTHGWIQKEALASSSRQGDDRWLLTLIEHSQGFDRIFRCRLFLDHFPRSSLRAAVLLLLGDAAEEISSKLSRDAASRLNNLGEAAEFSYFLNYSGLDRFNRLRIGFVFDKITRRFHYDGAAWFELIRRYPKTPQAAAVRERLANLAPKRLPAPE